MKLSVKQGHNRFKINGILPIQFNIPRWKPELTYSIKLDDNWQGDFELTEPDQYGVKLPGLGHWWDYHINGFNFAIGKENGRMYLWPRYYENGVLHELTKWRIEIRAGKEYALNLAYDDNSGFIEWIVYGEMISYTERVSMPQLWINNYTPYVGTSGRQVDPDNPVPGKRRSVATRDLDMKIEYVR